MRHVILPLLLLPACPAWGNGPAPADVRQELVHDFAALTLAQARQLHGRPARFRIVPGEVEWADENGGPTLYDCAGGDDLVRTAWLDLDPAEDEGPVVVEATLHVLSHPPRVIDGTHFPGYTELRLRGCRVFP